MYVYSVKMCVSVCVHEVTGRGRERVNGRWGEYWFQCRSCWKDASVLKFASTLQLFIPTVFVESWDKLKI